MRIIANIAPPTSALAADSEVKEGIQALEEQFSGRTVLLGVDRLDYTKGIIERLLAVEMLLERRADMRQRLAFRPIAQGATDAAAFEREF